MPSFFFSFFLRFLSRLQVEAVISFDFIRSKLRVHSRESSFTERWGEVIATLTARAVRPLAVAEGWTRFLVEPFDDTWQHFYLLCSAPLNVVRASYFCSCRKEQMLPILPASINAYHTHKASAQLIHNKFYTPRSSSAHRST